MAIKKKIEIEKKKEEPFVYEKPLITLDQIKKSRRINKEQIGQLVSMIQSSSESTRHEASLIVEYVLNEIYRKI